MNASSSTQNGGLLRGIAYRRTDGQAMLEADECAVLIARGLERENRKPGKREVTLLSAEAWADVCRELSRDLPWRMRRANLLVEGVNLASTIGREIAVGEVRLRIHGETKPCGLMDRQHPGLRAALVPECRGGVYGQVLSAGTIRVGDRITVSNS